MAVWHRKIIIAFLALLFLLAQGSCKLNSRYKTLDEAIAKDMPYEVKEIIHIEKLPDHAIVLYRTPVELPNVSGVDTIAVAFMYGNDEIGWKNDGPKGWSHYENNDMTLFIETAAYSYEYEDDEVRDRIQVVFGQMHNTDIKKVKVAGTDKDYVDTDIIQTVSGRYYFKVGKYQIVQGLSEDGEVLHQQGG
ncbi:MAG: hypothetical protein SCK29_01285 [Bacillota bacterium]|nr:hypothetical protein [Bacillota bacterium]MDW7682733.1 hypothetical protein [Bacillota bacterium]